MKNKMVLLYAGLLLLLVITGFVVYKTVGASRQPPKVEEEQTETLLPADEAITVEVGNSRSQDNAVVLKVAGLGGKIASVAYELTYESEGLVKGVNSGSKPIDVAGKDAFEREVYLGTCSRNVCKPDLGVKKVSVVLEFTDPAGKKSQLSQDYEL